ALPERAAQPRAKPVCGSGIVRVGPSAMVRDEPPRRLAEPDFAHGCAPSRTVRTPRPPHGIQEVVGSTPIGSTSPFARSDRDLALAQLSYGAGRFRRRP